MRHLLARDGLAAVDDLLQRRPLLAFDFDGTLAPIVAQPDKARVPPGIARRLAALAERLPVAIVSGRARADLGPRLGFTPHFLVGNHGAEDIADGPALAAAPDEPTPHAHQLDALRRQLAGAAGRLAAAQVAIEDKGASIALHYRMARDRTVAAALIAGLLEPADPALRVFGGKMVVNVMAADAPDKAASVRDLVARAGCDSALFAGDDVNDEPVFASAPADWLTVRIGRDEPQSLARWFLDGTAEVPVLLEHMLALQARRKSLK